MCEMIGALEVKFSSRSSTCTMRGQGKRLLKIKNNKKEKRKKKKKRSKNYSMWF